MHKHRVYLPKQKLAMGARLFACLKDPQQPPLCFCSSIDLWSKRVPAASSACALASLPARVAQGF